MLHATLTIKLAASEKAHKLRDEINLDNYGLNSHHVLVDEMRSVLPKAQKQLEAAAKKIGLKLGGAPDVQYGVHGSNRGAIVLWFQATAR